MQRITHIRYSFLDLPKAITTSVLRSIIPLSLKFTVMDLTVLSDFPMCCAISFLCCIWFFFEVVKYGYLFQSAV